MSAANDHFNRLLRGQANEPAPERAKTKTEAFNEMLRALGSEQYEAAFKEYQEAQRREEQEGK